MKSPVSAGLFLYYLSRIENEIASSRTLAYICNMSSSSQSANHQAKIVSVLVAIFLWFFVVTDVVYFFDMDIPLKVIGLNENKALVSPIPKSVNVRFRGQGQVLLWAYFTLPLSESALFLDVSKIHSLQEFHLSTYFEQHPDLVVLPRDFDMEFINIVRPETVWVDLEESVSRNIPVKPDLQLNTAPGYVIVGGIRFMPDSIRVKGAETLVNQVKILKTAPLKLDNVVNDIFMDLPVKIETTLPLSYSDNKIRISADVQSIGTRQISQIPISIMNVPPGMKPIAIPDKIDLTLEGGQDILLTFKPENFRAVFDFGKSWSPEQRQYPLEIETPVGVRRISSVHPEKVEIILR